MPRSPMEELYAKFLPEFVKLARSRIAAAITSAGQVDAAEAKKRTRELHTLAGEAGLLGLSHIVPLARGCEAKSAKLEAQPSDADAAVFIASLRELSSVIESLSAAKSL